MLSRLGRVLHLDVRMIAVGAIRNSDLLVHVHPTARMNGFILLVKHRPGGAYAGQRRSSSQTRLHCTMHLQRVLSNDEQSPALSHMHWLQAAEQTALERPAYT